MFKVICLFLALTAAAGNAMPTSTQATTRFFPKLSQAIPTTPKEPLTTEVDADTVTTIAPDQASSDIDKAETFGFGYYGYPQYYYSGYPSYYRYYPSYSYGYPYYY